MYVRMIETRSLKILLKSFRENYSDLFKKTTLYYKGGMNISDDFLSSLNFMTLPPQNNTLPQIYDFLQRAGPI